MHKNNNAEINAIFDQYNTTVSCNIDRAHFQKKKGGTKNGANHLGTQDS